MNVVKISEKVVIWMHRNNITQKELSNKLNMTRQTLASRLKNNDFTDTEIMTLKMGGFQE